MSIEGLAKLIATAVHGRSVKESYSGLAFSRPSALRGVGLDSAGCTAENVQDMVAGDTNMMPSTLPPGWTAYRDESWKDHATALLEMAPCVLQMFRLLVLDRGQVPAGDSIRSHRQPRISVEAGLAELDWAHPALAIESESLRPKAILSLGKTLQRSTGRDHRTC